ncbi:MAG: hypothetical protein GXP28_11785 [Planctomycetes bacterium]|nr:hypothetical protein [Planctomycetota bacterium]
MASGDSLLVFDPLSNRPPTANYASVDLRSGFIVLDFDDTTDEKALFHAVLPSHYSGGQLLAVVTWTSSTATTGDVQFRVEATRLSSGANLDTLPAIDGSGNVTSSAPTTSGQLVVSETPPISVGGAVAGDLALIDLTRLASTGTDTLAGDTEVVLLEIREV